MQLNRSAFLRFFAQLLFMEFRIRLVSASLEVVYNKVRNSSRTALGKVGPRGEKCDLRLFAFFALHSCYKINCITQFSPRGG